MKAKADPQDGEFVIGVALTGGRNSKEILKWVLDQFILEDNVRLKLLHVYPKLTVVPSPFGGVLPISKAQEDIVARFREEVEWKKNKMLQQFQQVLKANKVKSDIVILESEDIAVTMSLQVTKLAIRHLVLRVSSEAWSKTWKKLSNKMGKKNLSAYIAETAPDFCSVYIVADGKLKHLRPADSEFDFSNSTSEQRELEFLPNDMPAAKRLEKLYMDLKHTYPSFNGSTIKSRSSIGGNSDSSFPDNFEDSFMGAIPQDSSYASSYVGSPTPATPVHDQLPAGSEIGASIVQFFPLNQLSQFDKWQVKKTVKFKDLLTKDVNNPESPKRKAPDSGEESSGNIFLKKAATEAPEPQEPGRKNDKEEQLLETSGNQPSDVYVEGDHQGDFLLFKEIQDWKGQNGDCVQVQVELRYSRSKGPSLERMYHKQKFISGGMTPYNENCHILHIVIRHMEILSKIRHPHLVQLFGVILEDNCLVYEYMENGSLEDRLFRKDKRPPLPWQDRFRICWEVAGALAFLHSTKPTPIIHRDLKPANVYLDKNMVSKIGDVSLGTILSADPTVPTNAFSLKTLYKETSPVGTLSYIDPEYQRTGRVSVKSDIYALGVLMLQMLTARSAVGIAFVIEEAIDEGNLMEILDPQDGKWPAKEALDLALLGLQCAKLRGRDRPHLREKVLPALERLKEMAQNSQRQVSDAAAAPPPSHFVCPIRKKVMENPFVAADGYTYDRTAIEQWLTVSSTSPTTNHLLAHKSIMPDFSMLEAIKQWKSTKPPQ